MEIEIYKYILDEEHNNGHDQYTYNVDFISGTEGISIVPKEWQRADGGWVKRLARLVLTKEEAKALKKQL